MTDGAEFERYPERVRHSMTHPDVVYERVDGAYAVQGDEDDNGEPMRDDAGEVLVVHRGEPPPDRPAVPVYSSERGGPPAVPTGLVFVRFASGVDVTALSTDLAAAGYDIARTLPYAPNAVWVGATSGDPSDALGHLERLEELPDLENVEPQFLIQSHRRRDR